MDKDTTLTCIDCGNEFPFTVQDYQYYLQHPEYNTPVRCRPCRKKRKEERERMAREAAAAEEKVELGTEESDIPPAVPVATQTQAPKPATAEKPRTEVTCSGCGKKTTVPFVPRNNAPIYCRDCYAARKQKNQK